MKRMFRILGVSLCLLAIGGFSAFAQQTDQSQGSGGFGAGLNMTIGAETFNEAALPPATGTIPVAYQMLTLSPDLHFGKFGLGIDLTLHYRFTGGFDIYGQPTNDVLDIRSDDWVPTSFTDFFSLYLPKIRYLSYGAKGDPLYVKFGSIDDSTLGNGFIVGNYSNTLFLPQTRIFGLNFDMDGSLFKFPYVGVQTFVDDVTAFDLFGGEVYGRPLLMTSLPIIKNLQVGVVAAMDRNPYKYLTAPPSTAANAVSAFGLDVSVPILSNPIVSLGSFASMAFEQAGNPATPGGMVGFGGQVFGFLNYGAQIRFLGANFLPTYFGPTYDAFRLSQYQVVSGALTTPASIGWLGSAGFSALGDKILFNVSVNGPFGAPSTDPTNVANYPEVSAMFQLKPGVVPGIFIDASYDKKLIQSFSDLISAQDAVIGASINYQTGPAVITLNYSLTYTPNNPSGNPWIVTSGLSSSISLF